MNLNEDYQLDQEGSSNNNDTTLMITWAVPAGLLRKAGSSRIE
jgi:hypothetical protein